MGWDLEKFNALCQSKQLPDSRMYQEALFWKEKRVEFFARKTEEVWKHFWFNYKGIYTKEEKTAFKNAQFESETYIESAAQNLHSMADILCQIINKAVLRSSLHEAKVNMKEVIDKLQNEENTEDIVNALKKLRDSHAFKYIAAFVNTIKHRRLLNTDYYGEFGLGKRNKIGVRFLAFDYKKPGNPIENYDDTFAETILNVYMPRIFDFIYSVGNVVDIHINT